MAEADFVIIGSGSAGSALANRLTEDGRNRVIVLEFGGTDIGPFIQMPAALSYPMNMRLYDWGFQTEPEEHLGGRTLACPRGKVIGGSSSINGMVYVRGHARDFDHWAQLGANGWSYCDVLPYFKRMENWHGEVNGGELGLRGTRGPLHITRGQRNNPLFHAFEEAAGQAGFELTQDYNGRKQEGFGPMERTVWRGRRWSAANAYLKPALKRGNVKIIRCLATRVLIDDGKATGVEVRRGNRIEQINATREVIVSASAINSPKLLMLSGIGPGDHLNRNGIPVIAERPGVGRNLQDHLEVYIQQACKKPVSLYSHWNWFGKLRIGLEWMVFKSGLGASNHFESAGFVRSRPGIEYPDIQFHFLPIAIRYDGKAAAEGHGFQVHIGPMRSNSRGEVKLASPRPEDSPKINFNYMSDKQDWIDFRHCVRIAREIFGQRAFDPFRGKEILPGSRCQSDTEIDGFISRNAESAYHPCGTCRMGNANDLNAVVDSQCRVIGVDRLRVVDCSIFPRITNGNLNGPSIMVGEKAADHILGKEPLPRENADPWINPRWNESDR